MWTPSWFVLALTPSFVTFFPFLPALARKRESEKRAQKKRSGPQPGARGCLFSTILQVRNRKQRKRKQNGGRRGREV
jgi:hypothetical protein